MDEKKSTTAKKKKSESKITLFIITDSNEKILRNYHTDIICVLKYFRRRIVIIIMHLWWVILIIQRVIKISWLNLYLQNQDSYLIKDLLTFLNSSIGFLFDKTVSWFKNIFILRKSVKKIGIYIYTVYICIKKSKWHYWYC